VRSSRDADRSPAATRPRALLLALALLTLAVLVLRSPLDVLALATGRTPSLAVPTTDGIATVPDSVPLGRDEGTGGDESGERVHAAGSLDPVESEGRWGTPASRPTTELVLTELRGGRRVESGVEEAAALAVIAGHAWADAQGLRGTAQDRGAGSGAGGPIVVVEAIEQPGAMHAVVTLVVASSDRLRRIAVPFTLGSDGPRLAGAPWRLPAPRLELQPIEGTAIGDDELLAAARRAVASIGIDPERLTALEVTDGWPFIARLDDEADGHPWLRWHVDRFVVTGLPLQAVRDR